MKLAAIWGQDHRKQLWGENNTLLLKSFGQKKKKTLEEEASADASLFVVVALLALLKTEKIHTMSIKELRKENACLCNKIQVSVEV